ncbi:MAG: hypothetical protein PHI12_14530 [Dehalococcoidales bacterium]|nr:hypothetical protein [Dehalococcoidales bacterium]
MAKADAFFALGRLMEEYPMIVRNAAVVILLATAIAIVFWK